MNGTYIFNLGQCEYLFKGRECAYLVMLNQRLSLTHIKKLTTGTVLLKAETIVFLRKATIYLKRHVPIMIHRRCYFFIVWLGTCQTPTPFVDRLTFSRWLLPKPELLMAHKTI